MDDQFLFGCNYWASHAGTRMWADWDAQTVRRDLALLAGKGLRVLRVFPLWPDFQPISALYTANSAVREYRFGEEPLPDDDIGRAGMSEVMLGRFAEFAALAEAAGLRLVVGLITGWMSGRLFVPPALEGRDILTDPVSVMWQVRFVRAFVGRFKDQRAVVAWDLGNECNVMQDVPSREAAWAWVSAISTAIRAADPSRPVVSGMHSLTVEGKWTIGDQAELTDILTTHPYPVFTPYCDYDPIDTVRTLLHGTAESLLYSGVGGKPCMVEETGTLGPCVCDEERKADFVRATLFSTWAHGLGGYLWWCANDQGRLAHAPYDWNGCERELGLFTADMRPKPAVEEFRKFADFLSATGLEKLPPRQLDAACILGEGQDQWAAAYMSFVLAKQAGLELEFQSATQPVRDAALYLLPSLVWDKSISRRRMIELMAKVEAGASLYISMDGALMSPFEEITGVRVLTRARRTGPGAMNFNGLRLPFSSTYQLAAKAVTAEVLAAEDGGNPIFTRAPYGKGYVYFLGFPLESMLAWTAGAFEGGGAQPYYMIYQALSHAAAKAIRVDAANVGLTEHIVSTREKIAVLINYSPDTADTPLTLSEGWMIKEALYGGMPHSGRITLPACGAAVLALERQA